MLYNCLFCNKENRYRGINYTNKYCDNKCSSAHKTKLHKQRWYDNTLMTSIDRSTIRKYLIEDRGNKCVICGISSYNNKPLTLQVDHIDGNAGNNIPLNVRLLCPNCHSQQTNWGNKNRGNGRASRGLSLR